MPGQNSPFRSLERLPKPQYLDHLWADYIELLCLTHMDVEFSKADLVDHIRDRKDIGELEAEEAETDAGVETSTAERKDEFSLRTEDWFRHLEYRKGQFGDFYPFNLSEDTDCLIRKTTLTDRHRFYIFLLLASNLKYVKANDESTLTNYFEVVCKKALIEMIPSPAEVRLFHPSHADGPYTGNIWNRLNVLARDINEKVIAQETDFSPTDSGDKGLDLVAWIPIDDRPGLVLIFGQCACTPNWTEKQHSAKYDAWRGMITLKAAPVTAVFIPFCFRTSDSEWYNETEIHGTILLDRVRLTQLLANVADFFDEFDAESVVDRAVGHQESLY